MAKRLLTIAALLPRCAPAPAETVTAVRRDIIVTATRASQLSDQTGLAITRIDRRTIEQRQLPLLSDLLSTTPGVSVSRNGGPGQPTAVRLRGAEDAQTLVLIDGVRVNDPSAPAGAFDFGNLLAGNVERIEVLRGPNSVPWGSQTIGGVVNLVTSHDRDTNGRAEYGTNATAYFVGQAETLVGDGRFSAGGGYFRSAGVSAFRFGRETDGYRQYAGNARLTLPVTDWLELDLRGYYAKSKVEFDGFPPPAFVFADTNDHSKTEQSVVYAGANLDIGETDHRLAFALNDVNRDAFGSFPFRARGRVERLEYQGDAPLADGFRAVFGVERERSRFRDAGIARSTAITGGYAQLIVDRFQDLTVTGGVRVDDHRAYGTQVTASGNAVLRLNRTLFRIAYGEGFKAPTLYQLYSAFGNEALEPERARSVDFGLEQQVWRGRLGVTLFGRDTRNQIDFSFAPNPVRPFGFFANVARTRTRGVETFAELRPSDRLELRANYTWLRARNRATGLDLLRRPRHVANLDLDWRAPGKLRLGGSLQLIGDSRDTDFVTFAPINLDGYVLVGLRGSFALTERLELYGRVENFADVRYETVSGYGTPGRGAHAGLRVRL